MKLEKLKKPRDIEAQSDFLNRAITASWNFRCKNDNTASTSGDVDDIWFVASVKPPKWLTNEFGLVEASVAWIIVIMFVLTIWLAVWLITS